MTLCFYIFIFYMNLLGIYPNVRHGLIFTFCQVATQLLVYLIEEIFPPLFQGSLLITMCVYVCLYVHVYVYMWTFYSVPLVCMSNTRTNILMEKSHIPAFEVMQGELAPPSEPRRSRTLGGDCCLSLGEAVCF